MTFIRSAARRSYERERVDVRVRRTDHIPLAHTRSYLVFANAPPLAGACSYQPVRVFITPRPQLVRVRQPREPWSSPRIRSTRDVCMLMGSVHGLVCIP